MSGTWDILYRGSLSSCNYDCGYCPFAKTSNTREELRADAEALDRFCAWVENQQAQRIGILFTPWGEALIHRNYRQALVRLSKLPNVYAVSIQTNLSGNLADLSSASPDTLALWATYHPSQTSIDTFLAKCRSLKAMGIRHSVGVVGKREHFPAIEELRLRLPPDTYLWINAYKDEGPYLTDDELRFLSAIDPLFEINLKRHPSLGRSCRSGNSSFTVDHKGDVRRCHFVKSIIGNIHTEGINKKLRPSSCPVPLCSCYIGYKDLDYLGLRNIYGDGLLSRIPQAPLTERLAGKT